MRKFGQVWGSLLPYQKSQEISGPGRHPFGPSATTRENYSAMQPLGCRLVARRYVLGVLYGENRPKSENLATLTRRSSATVRRREKLTDIGNSPALGLQRKVNNIIIIIIIQHLYSAIMSYADTEALKTAVHPVTCSLL